MARVTAVFEDQARAEAAVTELRGLGVTDTDLSFVARNEEEAVAAGASADTAGKRAAKGAAAGAGAGLLFGLAALAIPGVGPFITEFYGPAVERGGVLVAVDTEGVISPDEAREVLTRNSGRTYDAK
jgi:hypothetical protein